MPYQPPGVANKGEGLGPHVLGYPRVVRVTQEDLHTGIRGHGATAATAGTIPHLEVKSRD